MARKKLLLVVGAVVVQAGVAWAVVTFAVAPKMRGEPFPWQKSKEESAEAHASDERELGALLPIEEVVVNVAGTKGRRFCRASITLEMEGKAEAGGGGHGGGAAETQWMPVYRGTILELLSTKDMDQLTAPAARDTLKLEILEALNAEATGVKFRDMFFTEFLVQ